MGNAGTAPARTTVGGRCDSNGRGKGVRRGQYGTKDSCGDRFRPPHRRTCNHHVAESRTRSRPRRCGDDHNSNGGDRVNIHEYQAKEILRAEGVPIPPGEVATTAAEVETIARRYGGTVVV